MKKQIGIITIPDYSNYGNRLQNYATIYFFQNLGYNVSTIEMNDIFFYDYRNRKRKLCLKKYRLLPVIYFFNVKRFGKYYASHDYKFEKFSIKYLKVRYFPIYNKKNIDKLNSKYDFFVLGSDQIWNPHINTSFNMYFASFAKNEKKIPWAVSFGVDKLELDYADKIKSYVEAFKYISVRENSAKDILENIADVETSVLCDPTLLVPRESWVSIAKKPPVKVSKSFVFSFFLGPKSETYNVFILKHFADKNIVSIDCDKNNNIYKTTGPSQFLWYILNADYILTDSFHACVFSIIFGKKFIAFSRLAKDCESAGLDSRVKQLLKLFNIGNRLFNKDNSEACLIQNTGINVESVIEREREKYLTYLKKFGIL